MTGNSGVHKLHEQCLATITESRDRGERTALVAITAVGIGRTLLAASDAMRFAVEHGCAQVVYIGAVPALVEQAKREFEAVRRKMAIEVDVEMRFTSYRDLPSMTVDAWPSQAPRYVVVDAQASWRIAVPIDDVADLDAEFTLVLVEEMGGITCPADVLSAYGPVTAHLPRLDWREHLEEIFQPETIGLKGLGSLKQGGGACTPPAELD